LGGTTSRVDDYLETLEMEMDLASSVVDGKTPVREVHFGGGTPNYLTVEQTGRLIASIREKFAISPDAAWSVEVDPRMATPGKLDALLENGFSRFSLGVQDMHPDVQKAVYRNQELLGVQEVVAHLRDRGIDAINFDLIYGLPAQTMETAQFTLSEVRKLRPNRIALYSYAHVPWIMKHQTALEKTGLPNPDEKIDLYLYMARGLIEAGYLPIGMDHFALPDDSLVEAMNQGTLRRTFMGYTTGKGLDTLGLGVSAISWVGDSYAQNYKDILSWRQSVEAGEMPWERGFLLSKEDLLRREVITQISCNLMVDFESLGEVFSVDVPAVLAQSISRLQILEGDGLIERDQDKVFVTERGRLFTRNICMVFDQYLEQDGNQVRYSRTV
tara:strand:- start:298 stop:1452 length:1155 start_codon:yes stop_codon:yes gene_type:complete